MMELWQACFFALILDLTFAKEISNTSYVIRKIESCPEVGYFFKRDLSPNLLEGTCHLCFCKENGTAVCLERERRRCDVEKYHHHRIGRQSRYRRSFSDVFFKDATRDFFGKNLPVQCKPYESSFSDGCPPEDWCIGCTICDCDSNGRWDCHILSFCDGKESKQKVKPFKSKRDKMSKKSLDPVEVKRPEKKEPTRKVVKKTTLKPVKTKPSKKNIKKIVKTKPFNKTNNRSNNSKKPTVKKQTSKKYPRRPHTNAMSQSHPKRNGSVKKIFNKVVATRKPMTVNRNAQKNLRINPNNSDTVKLGQKIVKQVMTTFKKMLAKEIGKLNETTKTRLMDGKDCGKVKKRDKRTYNERSKAAARHKNKYNKQAVFKENFTKSRIKRQVLYEQVATEKNIVITLPTDINGVIPLDKVKEEIRYVANSSDIVTSVTRSSLQKDNYYEYFIKNDKNDNSSTYTTDKIMNITEQIENDIQNNLVISLESDKNASNKIEKNDTKAINSDSYGLKFSKWYVLDKIKNYERKQPVIQPLPQTRPSKSYEYEKNTIKTHYISEQQNKSLERKHNGSKTYGLTTLPTKIYDKSCFARAPKNTSKSDITGLKSLLQNLYAQLNKTNTVKPKQKFNVNTMKYVRRFFHNLFSNKRTKSHKVYGFGTKEDQTLQILCENIGPCDLKKQNKTKLKYKLKELNKESKTILKSIRTVKGLLQLLELPDSDKTSFVEKNNSFQNDIQKLGAILRDYKQDTINSSITFTQKTQIDYIKMNTQTFMESVKKFADILTDILAMIKSKDDYHQAPNIPLKQQKYSLLHKIKKILNQYNIVQNTFMKRMYEMVSREEKKANTIEGAQIREGYKNQNVSDAVIEKNSRSIIENLRKLKNIALVTNLKRKKRELMAKDSALEYLLTLMEILIRQSHPLDAVPANDGIDLLIDAIKNAPDIKPIKRKDLYAPHIPFSKSAANIVETSDQQMSDSDSKKSSLEDNILMEASIRPKLFTLPVNIDNDITQKVYYRVYNKQNNDEDDVTTEYNVITIKQLNNKQEKVGFDKFESYLGDPKKLEGETVYVEDDAVGDQTTNSILAMNSTNIIERNVEKNVVTKSYVPKRTNAYFALSNETSSESLDSTIDKRTKIEWIEEAFDREIRMINMSLQTTTARARTFLQTTTITSKKNVENNSDITKEENTEDNLKKKEKKSKPDDVLYKKQIQFLNSLDYGTEKSTDFDESNAKDDSKSDDSFPAYFVE